MDREYIGGIRKETYNLLFKDENLPNSHDIDTKNNDKILDQIAVFTRYNSNNLIDKICLKIVAKKMEMDLSKILYDKEKNEYNYNTENKVIPFELLSDSIQDKKIKKELLSNRRVGKCHESAMGLIGCFENPTTILTGTCEKHGKKYLHSVIELQGKNNDYIVDYTLNLIMKKELYIELTQFENIESIKDIEALEDNKDGTYNFLQNVDSKTKPYLTFRKELKRDLEKNKAMLEETNNEKLDNRIEELKKQRDNIERE
jgi:hypothetical protein